VDRPRPLRLDEVRGFEYVDLSEVRRNSGINVDPSEWLIQYHEGTLRTSQTVLTSCVRCGRITSDPTLDSLGIPMPDHYFSSEEEKQPVCQYCQEEEFDQAVEEDLLAFVERNLGLEERHRDALRSFIETIFTDPKKILQVRDLEIRVRSLERQNTILWVVIGVIVALLAIVATIALAA
jgi:hypothetical protein